MDNLSDYVPLIIIVGSIIYSIVKGTGKKRQEEMSKTTLPGHKPKDITVPDIQPVKAVKKTKKKAAPPKPEPVVIRPVVTPAAPVEVLSGFDEQVEPLLNIEDPDEIKKAFIYTEILRRKAY
ncbi:MAG: hypothetical protein LBO74_15730 [Candidatus Symbiothrix sp.]|jgi:hypothetical protein|nr:hypothetical protein [Candidatus Symbiothrix sp.]